MRLANNLDRIHQAGAEVVALSVDPPQRNRAFARRWHLPFAIESDPGGTSYLRPVGLWNAEERDGIAIPALLVIGALGDVEHRSVSRDFADRSRDDHVLLQLEQMSYPPIRPSLPDWGPPEDGDEELKGFFNPRQLPLFFQGNAVATLALSRRVADDGALSEIKALGAMARSFIEAWQQRRQATS